jgi:two-component system LytT family response regulator
VIRVLIVDDEPLARETIRDLLARSPDVEIVGECGDGTAAVEAVRERRPDVLFLDIQMPELDGFDVLDRVVDVHVPVVVFVTAYDRYAVRAFEAQAVDYLLKPFDDERFDAALGRARRTLIHRSLEDQGQRLLALLEERRRPTDAASPQYPSMLMVRSGSRLLFVKTEQIDWIESEDYYARVHVGAASYLLREPMSSLEARLDPQRFGRVHRSTIVNYERVREIHPDAKGHDVLRLVDGTTLRMSRGRRAKIERMFRLERQE